MDNMSNTEFINAMTQVMAPLVEAMKKNTQETEKQQESIAEMMTLMKTMIKSGSFDGLKSDVNGETGNSRQNIRQEVIDTITKKQEGIYAQAFHRGLTFKRAQDALISGTSHKDSLGDAFEEALGKLSKNDPETRKKYETAIKEIKKKRDNGERVNNRALLGLFSSYATADWNLLEDDSPMKIKFFTMEHYFKNNVHKFFEMAGDSYSRVRNPSSIIKDFQRAVQKAWATDGFGINMDNDKTKLEIPVIVKKDIDSYVNFYMNSQYEQIQMGKTDEQVSSVQQTEKVVEEIVESDDEEPEPVVEKPKKTHAKKSRAKKTVKKEEVKEDEDESPKVSSRSGSRKRRTTRKKEEVKEDKDESPKISPKVSRRGRRQRRIPRKKIQAEVDSSSDSDSSDV